MTECARCGDCCRVISIGHPIAPASDGWSLRGYAPGELMQVYHWTVDEVVSAYEGDFIREHWHEIPRELALSTLPYMQQRSGPFYTCDMFDAATNSCTAHDLKPRVCWEYPWYDRGAPVYSGQGESRPMRYLESPRCSFWADVPWQLWPRDVLPLPSPKPVRSCC